jgi:hypothetical protein
VRIGGLGLHLGIYEARKLITMNLRELSFVDLLEVYANSQLAFLLESLVDESINQLVGIKIVQIDQRDSTYRNIDNDIEIRFGLLSANYKPKTISKMVKFFLPTKGL